MAATFSPELVKQFAEIAASEYRAKGITTALSPQIDLATDMARAYCDGFQTSEAGDELRDGWGFQSVNAMAKHWPGGGTSEGVRDSHFVFGKYGVYPGDNFEEHLKPFVNGAFKLDGPTGSASAVMPYYSIPYEQDMQNHENVGNSYNRYIITDLLRKQYGYDGVVCTIGALRQMQAMWAKL